MVGSKLYKWSSITEVMDIMDKVSHRLIAECKDAIDIRLDNGTMDVDTPLRKKLIEIEFQTHYMQRYDPIETAFQIEELYSLRNILTANQINELFKYESVCPPYFKENISDALKGSKHISLTEEFWHGINPYFWDD